MAQLILQTDPYVRLLVVPENPEECELIDTALGTTTPLVVAGWLNYGEGGDEALRLTLAAPKMPEPEPVRDLVLRWCAAGTEVLLNLLQEELPMERRDDGTEVPR